MLRAVILLLLAGISGAQGPAEPGGSLRVIVKDSTGAPADGVSIIATPVGGIPRAGIPRADMAVGISGTLSALSDEEGVLTMQAMAPGTYSVRVERARTTLVSSYVKIAANQETRVDFVIPADAAISGHVLTQDKEPVVDAFVWLLKAEYQSGFQREVVVGPKVTGEDGAYAFDDKLEANRRYFILVDRPPPEEITPAAAADLKDRETIQIPTYYPSATRMDAATAVALRPGERREQVDIRIATSDFYCVEGKIEIAGAPTSSAFAIHESALADTRLARARGSAGPDGRYHACGLSPGTYRLSTDEGSSEFTIAGADRDHVDLSADLTHLRLQVDWDGSPPPWEAPKLDAAGDAALRKLASELGIADPSESDLKQLVLRLRQWEPPKVDAETIARISAEMGIGKTPTEDESRRLSARVLQIGSSDLELQNALLQMGQPNDAAVRGMSRIIAQVQSSSNQFGVVLVSRDGNSGSPPNRSTPMRGIPLEAPLPNVPAGDYLVQVFGSDPDDSYLRTMTYNGLELPDRVVHLASGASGTVRVLMARGPASVVASVTDGDEKPVVDATLLVVPDWVTSAALLSQFGTHAQTDLDGKATVRHLAPGKYRILAIPQIIRWVVPEDLEKVLLAMFQAESVELSSKDELRIAIHPAPI